MYKITYCTLEAFFISTLSRFQDFKISSKSSLLSKKISNKAILFAFL